MTRQTKRDYYEVLGVSRTAVQDEIKSAYRKAALKWHPDRNPEQKDTAEAKFREATEDYSVLSDAQKRAAYDRYGHAGVSGVSADAGFNSSIFEEFQDIFGDFFGFEDIFGRTGGRGRQRVQRGADLRYDMELTFEEAAAGVSTKVRLPRQELCEACKGTGAKAGTGVVTCETCEVRIPPGVDSQTRIRVPNEGEPGANGAPPGDLYIVLDVKEHPFFERRGADLYCTMPVSIAQAALGAELSVPGLNGEEKVSIPEGTQTGSIIRLKGKGLPDPHGGGKGDLYVNVRVITPTKLTRDQRLLLQQLDQMLKVENRPAERNSSFFEKVKDIFG